MPLTGKLKSLHWSELVTVREGGQPDETRVRRPARSWMGEPSREGEQ